MTKITIIGAGAAGLMTAATILEASNSQDYHIHIFDKNTSPGKKVILSGGGRCNVTTTITDKKTLETKYVRGWNSIKHSLGKFSPKKCYEWFESHNVPLKIEGERVFPMSNDGRDIVRVFDHIFAQYHNNITLHYGEAITYVSRVEGSHQFLFTTKNGSHTTDILVIATGGNAYAHTGSTGDGYHFARELGHTITPLGPSLSSFLIAEKWIQALSGMSIEDAAILIPIEFSTKNPEGQKLTGSILFTHFGISGPLTFMLSSHLAWEHINLKKIFFVPVARMGKNEWDLFLKESFTSHPKRILSSILSDKLLRRFADGLIQEFFPEYREIFVGGISRKDRERIAQLLGGGIPITLMDRRPGDEFVTAGGISMDEIDTETMASKIQKNLYFAGEILNVDGYTGGFSLQLCWASGYTAGKNIISKL